MSKKTLFIFSMVVLGLIPASVTGASLFIDDFESGDFTTGGWSTQNGDASVSNKAEYEGTYGARLAGTTWIEKAVSTSGYTSIHVKYFRMSKGFDAGEYLYVEWHDGSDWHELESTQDTSWGSQQDKTCGLGADNNSYFKVRFRTNASASNEYAYVDYVEITGTSGGPTPGVTIVESNGSTDVDEEGPTSDTYTVVLDTQPTDTVTINVDPDIETEVNDNGAGNSIDLTFLTTNWDSPQTVTVKAIDDGDAEGAHTSTITHTATSNDNDYNGISIDDVVANVTDNDGGGPSDDTAGSDIPVSGTVNGSYTDTQSSNDGYESIEEIESGGKPANRYTYLEHKWTIDVTGGDTVTFYVEAYHTANTENDDFIFAYSTDNDTYTDMLTVTKTSDDDSYQSYELPSDTTGIVYIRVKDTDQTQGNRTKDTIYIDHMYVRSEAGPPGQASDPSPADEANNVSISIDLSWTAGSAAQSHDVYLGTDFNDVNDANTATSGIFKGNQDANSYDPGLLSLETTYYWRIDEKNDQGTTKGDVWSFSTANDTDGDNIGDNWESQYGLDPYDANDADQDLDSDNYNNLSEYLHETDPNDPNNVPSVNITIAAPVNVSTIQRAINASIDGDTVIVSVGTYYENINFSGTAVTLISTDPNNPDIVETTIIDANNTSVDVVTFNSGEDANSILEGITITGGRYGVYCSNYSSPIITKCTIRNNSHGLCFSGGGVMCYLCTIKNNNSHGVSGYGYEDITLKNCIITNNSGAGVYAPLPATGTFKVINCTVFGNDSYGISGYVGEVKNCIVWDNDNDVALNFGVLPTYCCIEDIDSGEGNIHADPMFIDAANGNYHLWYSSQCIDAGDPNSDYSNEPNDGGGRINMGAYGNTDEAIVIVDEDNDGMSDDWEVVNYLDPNDPNDAEQDLDGDGLRNIDEYNIAWDPNDFDSIDGLVCNTRNNLKYPTISIAINLALNFDTLVVDPNTFYETISFKGKPIHIRSTDPNDPNVVASTIIDANNTTLDVVTCDSGEDANSILEGMTITGGHYGINCYFSSLTITKCTVHNNNSHGLSLNGGTVTCYRCTIRDNNICGVNGYGDLILKNCIIAKNNNNGVYVTSFLGTSKIINCTIAGNNPRGIYGYPDEVTNCIIWNNSDDLYLYSGISATYCCIEDIDSGQGNIHDNPMFIDANNGDYHLWFSSQCIDAGDPNSDHSNEPSNGGGRINIGAYGNTDEATLVVDEDNDGMSDDWEVDNYLNPNDPNDAEQDLDGDGLRNIDEYNIAWDPNDFDPIDGLITNTRTNLKYPTISMAINLALHYDSLVLDPNTFYETISFEGKPVHIQSTDPDDPNVVASTIIDANNTSLDVVTCNSGEDANSILEGITITGGRYGIYCLNSSSPTITKCTIRNNNSFGLRCSGGGAMCYHCTIRDNNSHGVYGYGGTALKNCFVTNNSGRGVYAYTAGALKVINCTVSGNNAFGISGYVGEVENCIVWDNDNDIALALGVSPTFCCIEDGDPGLGNLSFDPCFLDADSNDFHLDADSPCIDAGAPWSDYSNEPSPNGTRINMGAYGNTAEAATTTDTDADGISDSWEKRYWPGDDPNQHDPDDNPDSDDFSNKAEYLFGYDPTQDTNEPMQILYVDLLSTQIDPTKGQYVTVEYWVNKDANEVETTFTNSATENVVRELVETAYEGVNYTTWGGIDASNLVVEPNFYDVNIVAESKYDSSDIDTWSSPEGDTTSPTYSNIAADSESVDNFNPYANLQIRVDFDLGDWATVDFGVCELDKTIICLLIEKDRLLSPGHHTLYWDGRDDNGQIYEGDFLVYQNFLSEQYAFGVKTGAIVVYYDYPTFEVKNLLCNSYRIVPLYNEVSTISYELTRDSDVSIDIVDPDGSHFRTLVDDGFYTAGTYEVVWDGKDDSGKYISTEGEYAIAITAKDPNHPEVKTIRTGSITVYR